MANPIDITVTQQALKEMDTLLAKAVSVREGFLLLGQSILDTSKNASKINTPSGLGNNTAINSQINADIKKQAVELEKLHTTIAKKAETSRLAEIRLQQAREKSFDSFERNANKEISLNKKNETAYQRIQNSVNLLTKTYQDLAIRKQLGSTLTTKEEAQLVSLTTRISTYQKALLATDATIGKNQRNVGNYATGYNALGNSINQLSREAPAFANSVNTGFMALSNNIPALFDALGGIRDQNKALAAEGKPTVGVLKQLAGALFSWQTLLSVGVTLLTLYGGRMIEFIGNSLRATNTVSSLAENQQLLNDSLKESSGSYAEQKVNIDVLYKSATDLNRSYKDRKRDVDELQQLYPSYFANLSDEAIMTGLAKDQYLLLSNAIVTVAKARASEEILQKRESERLIIEQEQIDVTMKKYAELAKAKGTTTYVAGGGSVAGAGTSSVSETADQQRTRLRREIQTLREESVTQRNAWAKEDAFFIAKIAEGNVIEQTLKPAEAAKKVSNKIEEDRLKDIANAKKKELELQLANIDLLLNNDDLYYSDRLTALDADFIKRTEIAKLDYDEEFRLSKGSQDKEKTALINFQLEKIKLIEDYTKQKSTLEALDLDPITRMTTATGIDPLKELAKSGESASKSLEIVGKRAEEAQKRILQLKIETTNWLNSFSSEFLQNSGMDSLQTFFDGTFEKLLGGAETSQEKFAVYFNAIAESAQQAFNLIAGYSQANFDNERKRIEDQQELAISYAGGSSEAIAKINNDAEKRKIEITNRENKAKQKQAIFNIAIDTAQGIVSALASTPPNIPLSIAIAAIGALQIGLVASQKVPQYFDGTDNHTGGAMIVNDGKGSNYKEKVVLPSGQFILPQGRNVLMNAPKGTKVLTHEQQLQEMMQDNGISMSRNINQNNGMTANEMDFILGKHFSNIKTHNTTFDKRGFHSYVQNGNSRTILTSNRVSGSGISV